MNDVVNANIATTTIPFSCSTNEWSVNIPTAIVPQIVSFSIENHSNHKNIENDYQSIM